MTYAKIHEVPMGQWATKRVVDVALPLSEVIVADPDDRLVGSFAVVTGYG